MDHRHSPHLKTKPPLTERCQIAQSASYVPTSHLLFLTETGKCDCCLRVSTREERKIRCSIASKNAIFPRSY